MKNSMLPIKDLETLYNEDNQIFLRHFPGEAAIQLRFDGNEGRFKYGEKTYLTNPCEPFAFNPVSLRIFYGRPFEAYKTAEVWVELYGITEAKCTFSLLLRGGSSTELNRFAYFLNIRPTETLLTLNPIMRTNKEFNKQYFLCIPEFREVSKADKKIMDELKCMLHIYSSKLTGLGVDNQPLVTILAENYCNDDYINTEAYKYFQVHEAAPTLQSFIAAEQKPIAPIEGNAAGLLNQGKRRA